MQIAFYIAGLHQTGKLATASHFNLTLIFAHFRRNVLHTHFAEQFSFVRQAPKRLQIAPR
jgi:hypothetical protein